MISDIVFRAEADASLKKMKIKKAERNEKICQWLSGPVIDRNGFLDSLKKESEDYTKSQRIPTENEEQCAFVAWFKESYPRHKIVMIRNDGTRTKAEKAMQIMMGLCAGAADIYIPHTHTWIEFKRQKGGVLSDKQAEFRDYVNENCQGDNWILALGFEDGKEKYLKTLIEV